MSISIPDVPIHGPESCIIVDYINWWPLIRVEWIPYFLDGFYKDNIPGTEQHIIMVLNSNLWYDSNKKVDGTGDPAGQFQWMESTLQSATDQGVKVITYDFTKVHSMVKPPPLSH